MNKVIDGFLYGLGAMAAYWLFNLLAMYLGV